MAFARNYHKKEHKREGMKQHSTGFSFTSVGSTQLALLQELKWKWKHVSSASHNTFVIGRSLKDQTTLPSVLPSSLWTSTQFLALLKSVCPLKGLKHSSGHRPEQ